MRTQTQVTVYLNTLTVSENLSADPNGLLLKIFMSCSGVQTKIFKVHSNVVKLNQTLKIKNIQAKELEFWLCTTYNKIIAVGTVGLGTGDDKFSLELKMLTTEFAKLQGNLQIRQYEIEKKVIIEPDQQLLNKKQDIAQKRRKQQEQSRRAKEAAEALEAAKNVKKPAVTLTRFNKKDQPFV